MKDKRPSYPLAPSQAFLSLLNYMSNKTTARDFFLHLLSTVLLYMGVISLIIVLFEIINHFVPDVLAREYYNDPADRMRFPTAMLIISFPVYAWTIYYIKKLINSVEEDTWDAIGQKLSHYGKWEFEDYKEE